MKPTKCPAKEEQKKRGGEKVKSKSQDCYVTFKPAMSLLNLKTDSKFCFLHMPELYKLHVIFCILISRMRSVRLVISKWL